MLSRLSHRCRSRRSFIAALLALAFLWQPIVLMATQAHASEHLLQTGHSHDEACSGGIPADEPPSDEGDERVHELLHQAHCCTSLQVIPSSDLALAVPAIAQAVPESADSILATQGCSELLRPPKNA